MTDNNFGHITFSDEKGNDQKFLVEDWSKWMKLYRIVREELDKKT